MPTTLSAAPRVRLAGYGAGAGAAAPALEGNEVGGITAEREGVAADAVTGTAAAADAAVGAAVPDGIEDIDEIGTVAKSLAE